MTQLENTVSVTTVRLGKAVAEVFFRRAAVDRPPAVDRQDEVHCARNRDVRNRLAEAHNSPQSGEGQFCHPGKPRAGRQEAISAEKQHCFGRYSLRAEGQK